MNRERWRVLYRQFLFRVFDLEVLSAHAQGDANKLLGQFAGLLVFISVSVAFGALLLANPNAPGRDSGAIVPVFLMLAQHFVIATTMLVVGLFAVLSWDATFPDRRDVMVLAPLPVRARTMFLAKVAAVATSLGLTIVLLHCAMGLILPLVFAAYASPAALPALKFDATPVPVAARDIEAVMDRDLRQQLTSGELAPGTGAGMAIGVWKHWERRVFTYGAAKPDSLFEIASISKTFTGLMLARMVSEGKVRLDEPVRELLPPGTVTKPAGEEITLLDLATHHSGLPFAPDNFHPADPSNPFADYGPQQLYAYLKSHGVAKPEDATFVYSSLGVGLLGQVLADRAGRTYPDQLREEITGPLGLADTVVTLSADQQRRFMQGYDEKHRPIQAIDHDGPLAGAGAIRSTAGDMLTYLEANLHPEKYGPLSRALALSHRLRERANRGQQIALAWAYNADSRTYWHNGATPGFTSHAFFNPRADLAAVVLINSGPNPLLLPDSIAEHIRQRLMGEPAISLDSVLVPATRGFRGVLRSFGAYWFTMLAAGVFIYGAVLGVQGMAALVLPRRLFLRLSGYLQLAAFCLIMGVYFLQPGFGGLEDLTTDAIWRTIQWLPSYWFLGLYQQLNGSLHPALEPLAHRAWMGLAAVTFVAAVTYTLSYWRTLRKIVEEPDIGPGSVRLGWLPRFGSPAQTAIGQFSVRTLARSKQHRLILGFYLGIGLAIITLMLKGDPGAQTNPWREESMLLWAASSLLVVLAAVGTRVAFGLPLDLRANWVFRVTGVGGGTRGGLESLAASRRSLLLLSVAPVWLGTAVACLAIWPGRQNAGHLAVLGLLGLIVADLCLLRFRKIPFTCSYLPGKSRVHMVLLCTLGVLLTGPEIAMLERHALRHTGSMALMLALLLVVWVTVRLTVVVMARSEEQEPRFEEEAPPIVQGLGLYRDGVLTIGSPGATPAS
jgi:CubicO group peptidase (beta-lactamase class C family)